jgi:hypothetical protein
LPIIVSGDKSIHHGNTNGAKTAPKMKRHRLLILLLILVTTIVLALYVLHNREPRYQGRTLTQWLHDYSNVRKPAARDNATVAASRIAVKQIGTNAIPFLLKKLTAKDTPLEECMKSLLEEQLLIPFHFADPYEEHFLGTYGFQMLGKDGNSAESALIIFSRSPDPVKRWFALFNLYAIEADKETFLPVLLRLLPDQDFFVSQESAILLTRLYPEEAKKAGVYKKFPEFKGSPNDTDPAGAPPFR